MLVGIGTDLIASNWSRGPGLQSTPPSSVSPGKVAGSLINRSFTRDVVPPELAAMPPLRDVYVPGSFPGLIGETTTSTSDAGSTVTIYVFSDPAWAQAFIENPPVPNGCGCTTIGDSSPVAGVGDAGTSYAVYRKAWVATTTYVMKGFVVVNGLYFPVSVGAPSPSSTDLAVSTAYAKAALGLVARASAGA